MNKLACRGHSENSLTHFACSIKLVLLLNHWTLTMSDINEHLSNSTESRGEKRVINYPNLSESERLKRKRKMETETTLPKIRKAHRK